jgi:hypothetical protein
MFKRVFCILALNIKLHEFVRKVGKERLEEIEREKREG